MIVTVLQAFLLLTFGVTLGVAGTLATIIMHGHNHQKNAYKEFQEQVGPLLEDLMREQEEEALIIKKGKAKK